MERYELADGRVYTLERNMNGTCTVSEEREDRSPAARMLGSYDVCRSWIEKQKERSRKQYG